MDPLKYYQTSANQAVLLEEVCSRLNRCREEVPRFDTCRCRGGMRCLMGTRWVERFETKKATRGTFLIEQTIGIECK